MNIKSLTLSFALLTSFSLAEPANKEKAQPDTQNTTVENIQPYRHIVMLQFKKEATPEQIKRIETLFGKLPEKINTITAYEWGTNISPENLAQGFTHCFLVTFKDKAGLDVYLPHQSHTEFVTELKPLIEKVLVFDFISP